MSDVDQIRAEWRRTSFEWGESDCIMSVCNFIWSETGIDPAAPWRGSYQDEAGAVAIYSQYGGVFGLFSHGMALAGFGMCAPCAGLPVVADFMGHEIAGIYTGHRVMFRLEGRGVIEWPATVLGAWDICAD